MYSKINTFHSTIRKRWSFWEYLLCFDAGIQIHGCLQVFVYYLVASYNLGKFPPAYPFDDSHLASFPAHHAFAFFSFLAGMWALIGIGPFIVTYLIFRWKQLKWLPIIVAILASLASILLLRTEMLTWFLD